MKALIDMKALATTLLSLAFRALTRLIKTVIRYSIELLRYSTCVPESLIK